ncbi:hypothetical protein [Amycolatopsis sp. NPDC051371]|uniref:hypothetical protein n=1 Tax=Amycolatopsis sp. NPDC051371 TaxID=3155800 RepID=UPI0034192395
MPTNAAATGFWTAQTRNNARQGRALLQAVYQNNDATPMNGVRSGVIPTTWDAANTRFTDLLVTVTSGLTMGVAPGSAMAHRSGQGPYEGWLAAAGSVTCDPAPVTNPRNDIVVMRWYDSTQGDTSPDGNPCRLEVITGTPGAVPVDPITVNGLGVYTSFPTTGGGIGIPLARAQVSTGGVITLTRLRRSVGVIGATRALLEGDSDTAGNVADTRYNPATDIWEVRDSTGTWRQIVTNVGTTDKVARGRVGRGASSTDQNVGTNEGIVVSCTFTAVSGRWYKFTADLEYYQKSGTVGTNMVQNIRVIAGGTATATAGTIVRAKHPNTGSALFVTLPSTLTDLWQAPSSGTFAASLTAKADAGQGGIAGGADHTYSIVVEDAGV